MADIDSAEFYSDGARYDLHHARHAFAADIPFYIEQARKRGEPISGAGVRHRAHFHPPGEGGA